MNNNLINIKEYNKNKVAILHNNSLYRKFFLHSICKHIFPKVKINKKPKNFLSENFVNISWGGNIKHKYESNNIETLYIDDGFICSNGLTTHLHSPLSLCVDTKGLYCDTTKPSDLENYLNNYTLSTEDIKRSKNLIKLIKSTGITKYNINYKKDIEINLPKNKKIILIIGQVEDDKSIIFGCNKVKTNLDLIRSVRKYDHNAFIIYKPHPDIIYATRKGKVQKEIALRYVDHIEMQASVLNCMKISNEIHTMTSLAGMEALIHNKKVITWGNPFYGGWGLTQDMESYDRRLRTLTLEELVFIVYELYPIYWDFKNNTFSTAESTIKELDNNKNNGVIYSNSRGKIINLLHRINHIRKIKVN